MKYALSTQHIELSDEDYGLLDEKLNRLNKLLEPPFTIDIRFVHDTHHRTGKVISCRISVEMGGKLLHAERTTDSVQSSLDEVLDAIRSELVQIKDKKKRGGR